MSFERTKDINGGKYKYEITSHWDKDKQQSRSTSHYIGKAKPADEKKTKQEKIDQKNKG